MCLACEVYGNIHISQSTATRRLPEDKVASEARTEVNPPTSERSPAQAAGPSEACRKATNES